jgi:hypothetical protein
MDTLRIFGTVFEKSDGTRESERLRIILILSSKKVLLPANLAKFKAILG